MQQNRYRSNKLQKYRKLSTGAVWLLLFISFCLFLPVITGSSVYAAENKQDLSAETITLPSFTELAKRLTPVTIHISTTKIVKAQSPMQQFEMPFGGRDPFKDFYGDDFMRHFFGQMPNRAYKQKSLGSGFIIDREGYILTNNHVVDGAEKIKVMLSIGKEYDAKVVGRDRKTDIALIKIKEPNGDLPVAELGDSDKLKVGEWVLAVGNPFGLQETVTAGIVSAKWRKIGAGPYDDFIQTDASINPGNSGGPLFNIHGEVVGVNTAIYTPSGGNIGIGFAIPVNIAKSVVTQLREKGKVVRGWLGVVVQKVTPDISESFKIKGGKGALVSEVVKNGPAYKAGLQTGDIILSFDGKEIKEMDELPLIVADTVVGKKVNVVVLRNGKKKTFSVTTGELQDDEKIVSFEEGEKNFGMTVRQNTSELADRYGLSKTGGVVIVQVKSGSPAAEAGLIEGDIIKEVNRQRIESLDNYINALKKTAPGKNILLLIQREGSAQWVVVRPNN